MCWGVPVQRFPGLTVELDGGGHEVAGAVCGISATLYSDHGADFTSNHISQVCADLRMQLIHSTPGVPRLTGKGERFFGSRHHRAAAHTARSHTAGQPWPAGQFCGIDVVAAGRGGR